MTDHDRRQTTTALGAATKPEPWPTVLARAIKEGRFTDDDKRRAYDWPTCAVSEWDHPTRPDSGGPVDDRLRNLGLSFADDVERNHRIGAAWYYRNIAERAQELNLARRT